MITVAIHNLIYASNFWLTYKIENKRKYWVLLFMVILMITSTISSIIVNNIFKVNSKRECLTLWVMVKSIIMLSILSLLIKNFNVSNNVVLRLQMQNTVWGKRLSSMTKKASFLWKKKFKFFKITDRISYVHFVVSILVHTFYII